ncbi:hypothetical protein OHA25_02550 [Nonomuraea sp. NBC_00507]|uniref:hypothetical protein n=1 Tax=Nonomuraea sp. NBC_00507 TaxID=2976002 RepID=UPI002E16E121
MDRAVRAAAPATSLDNPRSAPVSALAMLAPMPRPTPKGEGCAQPSPFGDETALGVVQAAVDIADEPVADVFADGAGALVKGAFDALAEDTRFGDYGAVVELDADSR